MKNLNLLRGIFILAVALAFGILSTQYSMGQLSRTGPGLFPFLTSCMLGIVGVISIIRSRYDAEEPMAFKFKNISIIILSLCGFSWVSMYVNMIVGIIFLVFFSGMAAKVYSVARNIKISLSLIAVAFIFKLGLGLNLPLY